MNNGTGSLTIGGTNNIANSLATLTLIGNVAYSQTGPAVTATSVSGTTVTVAATNSATLVAQAGSGLYNAAGQLLGTLATPNSGVAFTTFSLTGNTAYSISSSTALTIAANDTALTSVTASSDNSAVNLFLGANNNAVSITLGNGTNRIVDDGTGNMTVTVGTGANTITLSSGTNTITFGSHTGVDTLQMVNVSSSANLSTINGFVMGQDKLNLSIQNFTALTSTAATGPTALAYGLSGTGILAFDSTNLSNLTSNAPTIVNFPTVAGAITLGSIYSFGTTVYTVSSLATMLNTTNFTYSSNATSSGFLTIPALVTFGDGVHLELIKLGVSNSGAQSTIGNVSTTGIFDVVDFVGTTIGSASTMANSFGFVV